MDKNKIFFKNNVDFYSEEYRDYTLKPWERLIVESVNGYVLDVACGGGRITVPMLRRGCNVVGTDFIKEFEPKIRQHEQEFKGDFKFIESEMTALPFRDKSFDAVSCVNSIIYLKDISEIRVAIKEMSRVIKPGGKLFITSWNLWHPLWGISVVLNYILRRGRSFGATSPFNTTDNRLNNSKTYMFVPTRKALKAICKEVGLDCTIKTGDGKPFCPILVIEGSKGV